MMAQLVIFNKPFGVLCQFTGEVGSLTLADFIKIPDIYPAGRLDKNSEGLVLLTDDGALQHQLSHPKFGKNKYYWVQVEGIPTVQDLLPLKTGLKYKDIQFLPADVSIIPPPLLWERNPPIRHRANIPTTWLQVVLNEGKNHQVRKMTAVIGFPTLRLVRRKIADWSLGALLPGEYRIEKYIG